MFSLDVGLRAHEDMVPNEFQSTDWPALRSGVGTTSWTSWRSTDSWARPFQAIPEGGELLLDGQLPRFAFAIVLADVAVHGQAGRAIAATLCSLLRNMNTLDRSVLCKR